MAEGFWYYAQGGQQHGPVSREALRGMVSSGQVGWTELVWTDGMESWMPASSIDELKVTRSVVPPPPLPAQPIAYAAPGAVRHDIGQDAGMRMLLPVGRSGWAIAAGYLGLFSVLMIFAPIALIVSIIAIMDIRKHPQRHGMGRAIFGLIMGILGTGLLLFAGVAVVMGS
jgi:hypothetical protein